MNPTELETIVLNQLNSLEKEYQNRMRAQDQKITQLHQEFSELSEQLTKLNTLQTRLEQATTTLERVSRQINNL